VSVKRTVLRYHGGKWKLAPWIISHFPEHRIYVEPFGGAASVLVRKSRSYAEVYNDLDGEVVNVFRVLRDRMQATELERLLRLTPFGREEFNASYKLSDDPIESARRTMIRSYMGFGSDGVNGERPTGFRANVNRSGTTPAHDWKNFADAIPHMTERLQGVVIEHRQAVDVIMQYDSPETLHYVDPPYLHATRPNNNGGRKRYRHEMADKEHIELAMVLRDLEGMVIVSGYPSRLYDEDLFDDWTRIKRLSHADGARVRTEVLWISPNTLTYKQEALI
jgi:DNA adenine methylase